MNIHPHEASLDVPIGLRLDVSGDAVLEADIEIGFRHRGLEKQLESATFADGVGIAARVHDGHARPRAAASALGYALACEDLLDVAPPERARVLRVIIAELIRVGDHLRTLRRVAKAAGASALASELGELRVEVDDALDTIAAESGDGPLFRIGGLRRDVSETALEPLAAILKSFPEHLTRLTGRGISRRLLAMRLRGAGIVRREDAVAHAFTGPSLRASGIVHDVRKARPYSGYERYDFATPAQGGGDVWARFVQRIEECRESLRIVAQARDDLGPGPVHLDVDTGDTGDALSRLAGSEIGRSIESSAGELGYLIIAADRSRPHRVRIRAPSFYHTAALSSVLAGERLADVPVIVASFGLAPGEIDR